MGYLTGGVEDYARVRRPVKVAGADRPRLQSAMRLSPPVEPHLYIFPVRPPLTVRRRSGAAASDLPQTAMSKLTIRRLGPTHLYRGLALMSALVISGTGIPLEAQGPSATFDVFEASIEELQGALERGAVSSVELVEGYLARIAAYDQRGPQINAILRANPAALDEAARLDRERAEQGPRGSLHGIPVIVKDNYDTRDMATTAASVALATHRPREDAYQVRRLREAGAIILAKSNLHELAYGITTISSLGGQTQNPYDPQRNPGGSSGGTGAAVASSFAAVGWGSDTCGSIRIPAAVNNLFGLRPTKGLSSIAGIVPLSHSQDTGGPLARTATDLAIALDATIGPDSADPATSVLADRELPRFVDALDAGALRGARIGVLRQHIGDEREERETTRLVEEALAAMERLGAEIVEIEIPDLPNLLAGTSLIDLEFKWDLLDYLARTPDAPVQSLSEILERGLYHEAVEGVLVRSDRSTSREPPEKVEALAKRAALVTAVDSVMVENGLDALAYPSIRREAARIGEPAIGSNCQLSAATGMPALTVPAGLSNRGVPIGLELLGRPFTDDRLVAIGFAYEQAVAPRRAPPFVPALIDGAAPAPVQFSVAAEPVGPSSASATVPVRASFTYDPVMGTLELLSLEASEGDGLHAVAVRRGATGPIVHRFVGPGGGAAQAFRLEPTDRPALQAGELRLQIFTGQGPSPSSEAPLLLPDSDP
ncbi:MAG: amidase [Gemmatimonas sp.]|nr:amidase [Gemmatimonas sp.]